MNLYYYYFGLALALLFLLKRLLFPKRTLSSQGKSVVVTGAASGIGKSTVEKLISKGIHVFALDVNEKMLQDAYEVLSLTFSF